MAQCFRNKRTWGPSPNYPKVLKYKRADRPMIRIAGPCSIESEDQIAVIAAELQKTGVTFLRGGPWKAGTYPPKDYGLVEERMKWIRAAADQYEMDVILECLDVRFLDKIMEYADAIQIGARHCQDYGLLREVGSLPWPVTIKRGTGMKLDEFLGACEYLLQGKCKPMLIERGSSTFMDHVRWDLSVTTIAAIKEMTNVPIIVDASHGTGRRDLVEPCTLAGIASGADGFLVETHFAPEKSLSDSEQAFPIEDYARLCKRASLVAEAVRCW